MKLSKIREFIPLILILLFSAALRVFFLSSVPGALGGDELHYILTIKSVALFGQDLYGPWNIFSIFIFNYPSGTPQAELSYFLLYPVVSLTSLSLFTSKITFALLSVATVFAVYLLAKQLFDARTGLIAAFICAINPWQVFIGRTSYELVPAVLFYLLAIYFLIKEKSWRIMISLPLFILAFYSYIGTKVVLVPIVFAVSIFSFFANKKQYAKQYIILNLVCLALSLTFILIVSSEGGRVGDLFLPGDPDVVLRVDQLRKESIAPSILDTVLNNKITVYGKIIIDKFLTVFSPSYLFISTDNFVSIYNHGLFFAIDFIFLILGILFIFSEKRKSFGLFCVLLIVSTFPQIFYKSRTDIFSPHLALFLTFLIIPIAYGISSLVNKKRYWVVGIILFIYSISILNFLNIYFFQFPKEGHFDFASRELASYASRTNGKVDIYVQSPSDSFTKYIYFTNRLNKDNFSEIQSSIKSKKYSLGNVSFLNCANYDSSRDTKTLIIQRGACKKIEPFPRSLKISALDDGGELYALYSDSLCNKYNLNPYPMGIKLSDFAIESLSDKKFCEVFITK